jgi:hypothetical protein
VNAGGIVLALLGVWVITQTVAGGALHRVGLLKKPADG